MYKLSIPFFLVTCVDCTMYSVHTAKIICISSFHWESIKAFQSLQALSTTSLLSCNMHEDCTHFLFKAICLLSWTLLLPQYFNNKSPLSLYLKSPLSGANSSLNWCALNWQEGALVADASQFQDLGFRRSVWRTRESQVHGRSCTTSAHKNPACACAQIMTISRF